MNYDYYNFFSEIILKAIEKDYSIDLEYHTYDDGTFSIDLHAATKSPPKVEKES